MKLNVQVLLQPLMSLQKDPSGRGHRGGNPGVSSPRHASLVLILNPFYTSSDEQLLLINLPGAQVTPGCCLPMGSGSSDL